MRFTKMQALGNDYVYIELLTQKMENHSDWARFVSNRQFGVGSDGMILICPSDKADFRMRVFNPDGSEAEMCGNAIRSTAKFVYGKGFTDKTNFKIETLGGIKELFLDVKNGEVTNITAALGAPILKAERVPVLVKNSDGVCVDLPVEAGGRSFNLTAVSMGNPHCVTFVNDVFGFDVPYYGKAIENSPVFPQKANVEFAEVLDRSNLRLRTWERNCGETLACGTGCCVSTVGGVLTGRCDNRVTVHQLGGDIDIFWDTEKNCLYMTGVSNFVFDGCLDENAFSVFLKK